MSPEPSPAGAKVRAVAAQLVARVIDERVPADDLLPAAGVTARDQPLLAALVFGALRWHYRLEWQATRLLTRPLARDQGALGALLRIGLLQLQELRVPEHAAVSATVDATAVLGLRSARGLVNAVLRRFQREREHLTQAALQADEARFAHPSWLVDAIRADHPHDWQAVLEANNAAPPMWLRVNLLRTTRAAYLDKLEKAGLAAVAAPDVESAVCLAEPIGVDALPGFATGEVSVQDLSAQHAARLLELDAGQRVLDACAAPGGKTGHILEAMSGRGEVWAIDRDGARLDRVRDNLERLGLDGDARSGRRDGTGGVVGRPAVRPDSRRRAVQRDRSHSPPSRHQGAAPAGRHRTRRCAPGALARGVVAAAARGGRLVYATCSVLKRENDEQIAAFRAAEPTIEAEDAVASLQLLPKEALGDGFYYAWLRKPQVLRMPSGSPAQP